MKTRIVFVFAYFWLLLLFCAGLATLVFADKEERLSETEKRMLAGFPDTSAESIFSGEFSAGFESYLSDGVFMRDSIANASDSVLGIFSAASYEDTMLLDGIAMADELSGKTSAGESGSPAESGGGHTASEASPAPVEEAEPAAEAKDGYGLYLQLPDGGLELLSEVYESRIERVARTLNAYRAVLPEDGRVFYSCVPLTSYSDVAVKSGKYVGWYENLEEKFEKLLDDGAHMVSAPNVLNPHLMDEALFFQADHHWTPLAAWYLIEEMMAMQGLPVVPYDEYDYRVNQFYNTATGLSDDLDLMYPLLPVEGRQMTAGHEEAPLMLYDYEYYVAYLAGGFEQWTSYESGFSTGRSALVIGDSFSTAFVPYLLPYYDTVHRTDPRYHSDELSGGSVSELIERYGVDDVYIILSYDNGVNSPMSSENLEYLLYD